LGQQEGQSQSQQGSESFHVLVSLRSNFIELFNLSINQSIIFLFNEF